MISVMSFDVWGHWHQRVVFGNRDLRRIAIHRRGGRKDKSWYAARDRALDQRARADRVVLVIAERVGNRFGYHNRACKMNDGLDRVLLDDGRYHILVPDVADDKGHARGNRPIETGRKIVQHDDGFAGVHQRMNHVAADIAGAAGDQNRHDVDSLDNVDS